MSKAILTLLTVAAVALAWSCGRQPLVTEHDAAAAACDCGCGGQAGQVADSASSGGITGTGGSPGTGGNTVFIRVPDGGIGSILGDSGIIGGILDAPRDSVLGSLLCGPEAMLGAPCAVDGQVCALPSLGGVCACTSGIYVCPFDTTSGPAPCPAGATNGSPCFSPLSLCIGGGANACFCTIGSYRCL